MGGDKAGAEKAGRGRLRLGVDRRPQGNAVAGIPGDLGATEQTAVVLGRDMEGVGGLTRHVGGDCAAQLGVLFSVADLRFDLSQSRDSALLGAGVLTLSSGSLPLFEPRRTRLLRCLPPLGAEVVRLPREITPGAAARRPPLADTLIALALALTAITLAAGIGVVGFAALLVLLVLLLWIGLETVLGNAIRWRRTTSKRQMPSI
jgi:hypothetical protein